MYRYCEIKSAGKTLRGFIQTPQTEQKCPMIIMMHGLTAQGTETRFIFRQMGEILLKHGIAYAHFDFAGSGVSDGEFIDMTISSEVEDAKTILREMRAQPDIDESRVGVLGISLGGVVAGIVAGDCANEVWKACLWAPAVSILDLFLNTSKESLQEIRELGYRDLGGLKWGVSFMEDVKLLDIAGRTAMYDKPICVIHGSDDTCIPCEASKIYEKLMNDRCKRVVLQGVDHCFESQEARRALFETTLDYLLG